MLLLAAADASRLEFNVAILRLFMMLKPDTHVSSGIFYFYLKGFQKKC